MRSGTAERIRVDGSSLKSNGLGGSGGEENTVEVCAGTIILLIKEPGG